VGGVLTAELPAGVKYGHDNFRGGNTLFVHIRGDSPAVVSHGDGFIGVDDYLDLGTVAGERFVDGVVHQLEHHVVQAGTVIGVANVHAGALAHRIQALQYRNTGGIVFFTVFHCAHEQSYLCFRRWPDLPCLVPRETMLAYGGHLPLPENCLDPSTPPPLPISALPWPSTTHKPPGGAWRQAPTASRPAKRCTGARCAPGATGSERSSWHIPASLPAPWTSP